MAVIARQNKLMMNTLSQQKTKTTFYKQMGTVKTVLEQALGTDKGNAKYWVALYSKTIDSFRGTQSTTSKNLSAFLDKVFPRLGTSIYAAPRKGSQADSDELLTPPELEDDPDLAEVSRLS